MLAIRLRLGFMGRGIPQGYNVLKDRDPEAYPLGNRALYNQ